MKHMMKIVSIMLGVMTVASCQTDVDLDHSGRQNFDGSVQIAYNWGSTTKSLIPKNMMVLAYRILNTEKTTMSVNALNGAGYIVQPSASEGTAYDTLSTKKSKFSLGHGTYKFITFDVENNELEFTSLREFVRNREMSRLDVAVKYKTYKQNDANLKFKIPAWKDNNSYSDYIQNSTSVVFYDTLSTRQVVTSANQNLKFSPKRLTQQVDFSFTIKKNNTKQAFKVDSVFAEIAGVPGSFNITNGVLNLNKTYKVMFPTDAIKDTDKTTGNVTCHGRVQLPGIVRSNSASAKTGAGIMQVRVFCSYPSTKADGTRVTKTIPAKINLYNTLTKTPSITVESDNTHGKLAKAALTLKVSANLVIDGTKVIKETKATSGVDQWL